MEAHLPALQVIIPLIAAPLVVLCRNGYTAWGITLIVTWASFAISILLLMSVITGSNISYPMGDWEPPIGIEYRIDLLSGFVLTFITGIASVMLPYALKSVAHEIAPEKQPLFYCTFLLCFAGLLGIVTTNDVFNIYVFLEISSLATYTLIAMGKDRRALTSAFEYLILGTIGATFFLIGIGLLYMVTGTLNISDLAEKINTVNDIRPVQAAFAFLTVGLALKIGMFPLHLWLTNAYAYAPSFISAFLAATASKVSLYLLIRIVLTLFGVSFSFVATPFGLVLLVLAVLGILVGSLTAIFQKDIKRMLAFSSVAQIGYIGLGLALATTAGLTGSVVHLLNHAMTKGALFLAVGCVFMRVGGVTIDNFRGIGKQMPWTMAAFTLAGLSLIGIPGTAGFISKWYFITALLEKDMFVLVGIILISSLLAAIYIWKVIEVAYFQPLPAGTKSIKEAPAMMLLPTWLLVIAGIYFGINTDISLGIASNVAKYLLGANL